MVKCHVVDVHMTPLRDHNIHTIKISNTYQVHMITCNMISRDLKNKSNYSEMIIMLMIRGVLNSIRDLDI